MEENSYFNEAQGFQTPPLQPQTLSSTDVSPDQNYFPLSAPPPTPLGGITFGGVGVGDFNPGSAFNVAALSGGIAGLGALGTLGGLLGGLESGASGNGTWSGRARGLSRSGDNVFMGSTSAIEDGEEGELGCGMGGGGGGGGGSRGGVHGGGNGGTVLSRQDVLEKILSNLHRLGTE